MLNFCTRHFFLGAAVIVAGIAGTPVLAIPPSTSETYQIAQLQQGSENIRLNLTEKQQKQVDAIRANQRKQIASVLTEEQKMQFEKAIESGQRVKQALRSLNLTDQQRDKIRTISDAARKEIEAVLTPEQRQLLKKRQ